MVISFGSIKSVDYDTDTKTSGVENNPVRSLAVTVARSPELSPPIHTV